MRAICPIHPILLAFITLMIFVFVPFIIILRRVRRVSESHYEERIFCS